MTSVDTGSKKCRLSVHGGMLNRAALSLKWFISAAALAKDETSPGLSLNLARTCMRVLINMDLISHAGDFFIEQICQIFMWSALLLIRIWSGFVHFCELISDLICRLLELWTVAAKEKCIVNHAQTLSTLYTRCAAIHGNIMQIAVLRSTPLFTCASSCRQWEIIVPCQKRSPQIFLEYASRTEF
jgi:hypothetical protein